LTYIATTPRPLQAAALISEELKLDAYAPAETVRRRLGRGKRDIRRPLMPGYVFVNCEPGDIARIAALDAVTGFVRRPPDENGDRLRATIPPDIVQAIRDAEANGEFAHPETKPPQIGQRVRTSIQAWRKYIGELVEITKKGEAVVAYPGARVTVKMTELEAA
jgi:transcription antitermination factor NusG